MSVDKLPDDKDIIRGRNGRYTVLILSFVLLPVIGAIIGFGLVELFTSTLMNNHLPITLGVITGAFIGFIAFMTMKHRFFVINSTTGILITTDSLKALLGHQDIFVPYGPGGPFVAYPWENRDADGNISIKTATNDFACQVQCKDGLINVRGSYRLRPDYKDPRRFQTGVATVADDLKDLVIAFLIGKVGPMKIEEVLKGISILNDDLKLEFVGLNNQQTAFEKEHGVHVVDVTLSNLLPSEEVQRTMSSLTEADIIAKGTQILLGYASTRAMNAALKAGQLTRADFNHARDRFMAVSGNMDGVNVTRYEVDLNASGIEKDTAEALAALLRNTPPQVLAGLAQTATKGKAK